VRRVVYDDNTGGAEQERRSAAARVPHIRRADPMARLIGGAGVCRCHQPWVRVVRGRCQPSPTGCEERKTVTVGALGCSHLPPGNSTSFSFEGGRRPSFGEARRYNSTPPGEALGSAGAQAPCWGAGHRQALHRLPLPRQPHSLTMTVCPNGQTPLTLPGVHAVQVAARLTAFLHHSDARLRLAAVLTIRFVLDADAAAAAQPSVRAPLGP